MTRHSFFRPEYLPLNPTSAEKCLVPLFKGFVFPIIRQGNRLTGLLIGGFLGLMLLGTGVALGQATESQTFSSDSSFTVPLGVTEITIQTWGAGGGGGGRSSSNTTARGGGGGAFASSTLSVTPGTVLTITVGTGGSGGPAGNNAGSAGGFTAVNQGMTVLVRAAGGAGGSSTDSGNGGAGGTVASSIGQTRYAGGNGVAGGGGGAGTTGAGGNASGNTGGTGTSEGGGNGGTTPFGLFTSAPGSPGSVYGGAGSGARVGWIGSQQPQPGGNGANGGAVITWFPPSADNSSIEADPTFGLEDDGIDFSTITITVRNTNDDIMGEDIDVHFEITSGNGTLGPGPWTTGTDGKASTTLTSTVSGLVVVTGYLGSDDLGEEIFTATVGFGIDSGNLFEIAFSGNKGWRMLAFPLQEESYSNIFDTSQNSGLITQGFPGSTRPDDAPNLLWYLEDFEGTPNDRWRLPGNLSHNATPGRGYLYYVFGRIDEDPRYSALPEVDEIAISLQSFEQNASSVDFGVTYTAAADSGWNLIGNPFANDLNWDATTGWTRSDNISGSIYIWDPLINFDEDRLVFDGDYLEWNRLSETGSLDDGLIASGQAFWVKVMDNSEPIELEVTRDAVQQGAEFYGKIVADDRAVSGQSDRSGNSEASHGSNQSGHSGHSGNSSGTYGSNTSGNTGYSGRSSLDVSLDASSDRNSRSGGDASGGHYAGSGNASGQQTAESNTTGQQAGTGHTTGGLSGRLGKPGAADLQAASTEIILSEPTLELVLTRDHFSRSAFIAFREGATRGIDAMDAWYLQPLTDSYITLASIVNGQKMAINTLPRRFNAPMEIPLHVGGFRDGVSMEGGFELSLAQFRDIPDSWAIELVEKKTGERVFWKQAGEPVLETRSDGRISLQRRFYTDSHEAHWTLPGVRQADDLSQGGGGLSGHRTAGGSAHSRSAGTRTGAGTTGGTTANASSSPKGTSQGTSPHGSGSRPHGSRPASSRIPETTARHDFEFALEEPLTIEAPKPGEPIRMKAMTGTTESRFVLRIYPNGEFPELPEQPTLGQNYPNPFNPVTTIPFSLPMEERVHIEVFDILGRRVQTLTNDTWAAGSHTVTFDGTRLASGVYIIRMRAGSATETSKMTLIK